MSADASNPFDDLIVKEPRRREPAVHGLNEEPVRAILRRFEILAAGSPPRELRRLSEAQLVTSVQAGYGKSHLIGRLFQELRGRATLIYVMPFQNPATVFQSLMMTIARELHFPERADAGAWDREEPTQLDQLAHAVLAQTLADLVESGRDVQTEAEDRAEVIARLRNDPMGSFNRGVSGANWADWMRSYFTRLLPLFEEALARRGLTLSAPGAWLRVLRAYAFAPFDLSVRRACLDWLTGQPLEPADLEALGLKPAEAPNVEADPSETNEACRHRVMDLCQLAVFHRPFVFCFDQTEVYGHRAPLARAFGMALGRLVDEAANQLTLVTSNQSPWTERIAPNLENADLDRIAKPFLTLKGLNREQGEELARLRMEAAGITPERQAAFLGDKWLAEIFPAQTNELGARHFLQKCRERWNRAPSRDVPLKELFQEEREKLLAAPKRHLFEPDTLQWLIEEAARGVDGIVVKSLTDRYFSVCWQTTHGICYFGFVSGSFWRQWRAIARAALADCGTNPRPAKAVFFRTPEQPPIPGATWTVAQRDRSGESQVSADHCAARRGCRRTLCRQGALCRRGTRRHPL